jgi:predicted signal transduction protein with EAL and GGDEF domain
VSTGIAQFKADESIDRTIARADEALYRAKSNGRNRVVVHGQPETLTASAPAAAPAAAPAQAGATAGATQ